MITSNKGKDKRSWGLENKEKLEDSDGDARKQGGKMGKEMRK